MGGGGGDCQILSLPDEGRIQALTPNPPAQTQTLNRKTESRNREDSKDSNTEPCSASRNRTLGFWAKSPTQMLLTLRFALCVYIYMYILAFRA